MKGEYDFSKGKRGAVLRGGSKTRITIYLDTDLLEACRERAQEMGIGYQTFINRTLREQLAGSGPVDETAMRRILREELERAGS